MELIATPNGKVGHVVDSVVAGADGRVVTTVCGKTFNEVEIAVNNDLDECSACDKKVKGIIEDEPTLVATADEVETVAEDDEPKTTSKKK